MGTRNVHNLEHLEVEVLVRIDALLAELLHSCCSPRSVSEASRPRPDNRDGGWSGNRVGSDGVGGGCGVPRRSRTNVTRPDDVAPTPPPMPSHINELGEVRYQYPMRRSSAAERSITSVGLKAPRVCVIVTFLRVRRPVPSPAIILGKLDANYGSAHVAPYRKNLGCRRTIWR
jgi:hypothetical protein